MSKPIISLKNISKRFGSVQALRGAHLTAWAGEVHVILGENGAGKSTLMNILVGLYQPDEGECYVGGHPVNIRTPADARRLGIAMVAQHAELIPNITVWENVVLGQESTRWLVPRHRARVEVERLVERYHLALDPDASVEGLSAGEQQKLEILKMLYRKARILILDEPTTFLTPQESDELYDTLSALAGEGYVVLLVTHKLRDALKFGRRLTVMREGRVVAEAETCAVAEEQLVRWIMGEGGDTSQLMGSSPTWSVSDEGPVVLKLTGVTTAQSGRVQLHNVDLQLRAGEIHGIAGVAGNGQRELTEAILGVLPVASGEIRLGDDDIRNWPVDRRLRAGLCIIPEDRIHDGSLPEMSVYENFILGAHRELFAFWRYSPKAAIDLCRQAIVEYDIKAPGPQVPVAYLSGGNIQKVIVARVAVRAGRKKRAVVIATNPTRGLDVRAARKVLDQLRVIAGNQGGVLLISEDLDELVSECQTISVMYQGRLVATFKGPPYDRYAIGEAMLGRTALEVAV